jgi:hypothetical protein
MRELPILLFTAVIMTASPVRSDSGAQLRANAEAAVVVVKPLPDGRRLIPLPGLEFTLIIEPQCAAGMQAESISISVADTRMTITGSDLDGHQPMRTSISIPRKQVSPLAVEGFCLANRADNTNSSVLLIKDAFTANISLRCAGENKQTTIYASQPLNLHLQCETAASNAGIGEPGTAADQD